MIMINVYQDGKPPIKVAANRIVAYQKITVTDIEMVRVWVDGMPDPLVSRETLTNFEDRLSRIVERRG